MNAMNRAVGIVADATQENAETDASVYRYADIPGSVVEQEVVRGTSGPQFRLRTDCGAKQLRLD